MDNAKERVGIIGAGISGLVAGRELKSNGFSVDVFEKSRGFGGRMATRRTAFGTFDHGAQYFTASSRPFIAEVELWIGQGAAAVWDGCIAQWDGASYHNIDKNVIRYVGTPTMNAPAQILGANLDVKLQTPITSVSREGRYWRLHSDTVQFGPYEHLIVTAPAEQTQRLLGHYATEILNGSIIPTLSPVWAGLFAFDEPINAQFDGCFVNEGPLSWIACNGSKPKRTSEFSQWVVHAGKNWSTLNFDLALDGAANLLLNEFQQMVSHTMRPVFATAHRWLYATPETTLAGAFLFNNELNLGICGDWCKGPKVEGAYLSGLALAKSIVASH